MRKLANPLIRYWKPLLCLNIAVGMATVFSVQYSPRNWTANAQLILPESATNLDANLGTLGQLKDQGTSFTNELNPLKVQASILSSNDVMAPIWSSDPEKSLYPDIESYKKLFKMQPMDQSTVIQLNASASDRELAKGRLDQLIESYKNRLNKLREGTAEARLKFTQNQLEQAESKLVQERNGLLSLRQSSGLVDSEEQTKGLVQSINSLQSTQAQLKAQTKASEERARVLADQLKMTPQQALSSVRISQNKEYQSIRQKLSEVSTTIASERGRFTEKSAMIQALLGQQKELSDALKGQLARLVPDSEGLDTSIGGNPYKDTIADVTAQLIQADGDYRATFQQSNQLQQQIDLLKKQLIQSTTDRSKLLDLQRKYDIAEGGYKGIVAQLEQAKLSAFNSYPNVQVLDQSNVSIKPTTPKRSLIYFGGALAAIFGSTALVTFLESRNPLIKLKNIQELPYPILLRLPRSLRDHAQNRSQGTTHLNAEAAEFEFQRLASALSLMPLTNRRVLVTSAMAGEGKTTVALGLAMALVDLGFRILIVDGDYRRAQISQQFGYDQNRTPGLPMTIQVSTNLELLPTSPNPHGKVVELIARGRFERDLNALQAAGGYDFVIVDSAPMTSTSETALMAKAVSNVLMVVCLGVSDRHLVQEAMDQLIRHDAKIIGLALNGVEPRAEKPIETHRSFPSKADMPQPINR